MNGLIKRKSPRLTGYNYSKDNCYFITSCVKNKMRVFGAISNGKMELNEYGRIAYDQLIWLNEQYQYVKVHEFVIMQDHACGH